MEQEPQQPTKPDDGTSSQAAGAEGQGRPGAAAVPGVGPTPGQQPAYPFYPPYAPPPLYPPPGQYPASGQYLPPGGYPPQPPSGQYPQRPFPPGQYPASGGYPAYGWQAPAGPPAPPPQTPKRSMPLGLILLLVGLAVVVIAAGVGGTLALTQGRHGVASRTATSGTPTATATAAPPNWFDFKDPLTSSGNGWSESSHCYFQNGTYHVNPGTGYGIYWCFAPAGKFSNFDMHVTVEEESGPLSYGFGLIFHFVDANNFYDFVVNAEGEAWVSKWVNGTRDQLSLTWTPASFARGLNVPHTLRVVAQGSTFICYVDGVQIGSVSDSTFTDGRVGLYSGDKQLDAAFTNFEVAGAE